MSVLVVGAGPTGLTTAMELARSGTEVKVVDQREVASGLSRAVGISPLSLKLLEPAGVAEKLIAEGVRYTSLQIYKNTRRGVEIPLHLENPRYGYDFMLGLAQDRTEYYLAQAVTSLGGSIHYKTALVDLQQNPEHVVARFADGNEESFDYVIGADGIRSMTRSRLGLDFQGFELGETWSIADVEADEWLHPDSFTLCMAEAGKVAAVAPMEKNRFRIVSNTPNALETLPLPVAISKIRREATFSISVRQVDTYSRGRVFLAGDAAHCHSPVGGRGMNLGIADAVCLAECISSGKTGRYSSVRHSEGQRVIELSERARRTLTSGNDFMRSMLIFGLKTATAIPSIRKRLVEQMLYA